MHILNKFTTYFTQQALECSPVIRPNRRNSCTQITDGEVDTMITETENPTSEQSPSRKSKLTYFYIKKSNMRDIVKQNLQKLNEFLVLNIFKLILIIHHFLHVLNYF